MKVFGLTGGIGCGKSTVTRYLAEQGALIVDADQVARQVVEPGQPTLTEVVNRFGQDILHTDGRLNRASLAKTVFNNDKALAQLEAILHPAIRAEITQQITHYRQDEAPSSVYMVVDIPLLIERNYQTIVDQVIVVDCTIEQQIERVMQRDDRERTTIVNIIDKQVSREDRLKAADIIVDNSDTLDTLHTQLAALHKRLLLLAKHA